MRAFLRRCFFCHGSAQAGRKAPAGAALRGMRGARARGLGLCALGLLAAPGAQALQVKSFVPQGEVTRVRQVVVQFDRPAVAFGDATAPAPLQLSCSDAAAAQGAGRWNNEREWVFDFAHDLPPGVRCTATLNPGFKSPSGEELTGTRSYQFNTGGPFVQRILPRTSQDVDEEQYFVLQLNGPATAQSVQEHVWCVLEGVGERVDVQPVVGKPRAELLRALALEKAAAQQPQQYLVLACRRRLPSGTRMQLVFGAGVATPSGVVNRVEKRFDYRVRAPFEAQLRCERENAQAACLPIRPLVLDFSAPVPRKLAAAITLRSPAEVRRPVFDEEDDGSAQGGSAKSRDDLLQRVQFAAPLPPQTRFTLELPKEFHDAAGRPLRNAASFPLAVATGPLPPLAKFAAAPFGVIERYAEGTPARDDKDKVPALLPVTLRNVEAALRAQALRVPPSAQEPAPGRVRTLQPHSDAEIIAWYRKVLRYDRFSVPRNQAQRDVCGPLPPPLDKEEAGYVQTRMLSLLDGHSGVRELELPRPAKSELRPFEVVGIPLAPGFHVVEIASSVLGGALLDARYGAQRRMVVRTSALVTNLGVHFKLGRDNALAWVTTLDKGQPVAGAQVRVSDCQGRMRAAARTDAQGVAHLTGLSPEPPSCRRKGDEADQADLDGEDDGWDAGGASGYFVSARVPDAAGGGEDMAFVWSGWQRGIEPWRFGVPTSSDAQPDLRAHTVFDRTLLRAGETVSMKHLLRTQTRAGFGLPARNPDTLLITHVGSGQQYQQPLSWYRTATGGRSALSSFQIPPAAKLGRYAVDLHSSASGRTLQAGQFRVEEFRLPVFAGQVAPVPSPPLVRPRTLPVAVQLHYVAGGPAAQLPLRVSALLRDKAVQFGAYDAFSFRPPRPRAAHAGADAGAAADLADEGMEGVDEGMEGVDDDGGSSGSLPQARVVADKLALTLDAQGAGRLTLDKLPALRAPQELLLEASYADPNGELQTLRSTQTLWPARVVAGIKAEGWVSARQKVPLQALALGLDGKPQAGVALQVQAILHTTTSTRKRLVGGFYSYDNRRASKDLGTVCSGKSDARGLLLCAPLLEQAGEVELVATATDREGNTSESATSVWITRQGELWFGGADHDRMDVLPEKKSYQPGETARFQVRMPFREATALVSVEREGILETQVLQLSGKDPTVRLQVRPEWGPNVYVSVLALRGRLYEVPWYSFFTWGYQSPRAWWHAFWAQGREYQAPSALVDLSKPSFRLGMAEIQVGARAHQLQVQVQADQASYPVRGKAQVRIAATLPDGKPAAHAEVAVAAVDKALLELMPNTSWNLLDAMLQRRSWGVQTATAQMEIVGRRHYGKKAAPAGGDGGGHSSTRELFDTLLLWQPAVQLDAQGQATLTVPLNDALSSFEVVAVADAGTGLFGTGRTRIRSAQDLQIISGLPPLVRAGDQFRAQLTLRNTTARAMQVEVAPRATRLTLDRQTVAIPAGESRELAWNVTAPAALASLRAGALLWEVAARDRVSGAQDALKLSQRVLPAVPLAVQQATLVQLGGSLQTRQSWQTEVAPPAGALADPADPAGAARGGVELALVPRLAEGLPGVRAWFADYPFVCLEQKVSKAVGMRDGKLWQTVLAQLPSYLDDDGLANYFPPQSGSANRGSDTLTAYLLAATHEAAGLDPVFALPDAVRAPLERGLIAFVEGRIERNFWSPRKDLDMRKLAAIEALSRYGKAQARMLESVRIAPNEWPTHSVIDWLNILRRVPEVPQRAQRLSEATHILKARLAYQGSRLVFRSEQDDYWWWLMQNGDVNAARLLLAVQDDPAWKDELGRLVNGFIARQQGGAWHTTTANLWGGLALEKFSARFESAPVVGHTRATLGQRTASVDWARVARGDAAGAPHPPSPAVGGLLLGAPAAPEGLQNKRMFLPWGQTAGPQRLSVAHQGTGRPWLTLRALAAVERTAPFSAGYTIRKTVTPIERASEALPAGRYTRGDVLRVTLEVTSTADMSWVAITDPIPGGASILGSGLGRDSEMLTQGEKRSGAGWPAFEERSFEALRSYYEYLPKGTVKLEYTLRLHNAGDFALPPTRAEALYAPEMFGELPNPRMRVEAAR